uniref:Uncharacterized protein n=1 Tax=Oryza meridionalis TaxID=40149 RepID=A0A0E0C1I5_9ORYZ
MFPPPVPWSPFPSWTSLLPDSSRGVPHVKERDADREAVHSISALKVIPAMRCVVHEAIVAQQSGFELGWS